MGTAVEKAKDILRRPDPEPARAIEAAEVIVR
jgi:hypothetical protein